METREGVTYRFCSIGRGLRGMNCKGVLAYEEGGEGNKLTELILTGGLRARMYCRCAVRGGGLEAVMRSRIFVWGAAFGWLGFGASEARLSTRLRPVH